MPVYPPVEEAINIASHAVGLLLSVAGMILLLSLAAETGSPLQLTSFAIFGASLVITYGTSTVYHACKDLSLRRKLRILDHASIYVLIAGTYTPFTLITLQGVTGWVLFGVSWGMALTGIILKLFFTGHFTRLSTAMYLFMGWIIVFAFRPLLDNLAFPGLMWLLAGGLCYTLGGVLYGIRKMPLNHAAFHLLTLAGSGCHFVAVYFYVL